MLRIINNGIRYHMASIPHNFIFKEKNKYNFITRNFDMESLQKELLPPCHNLFHNLLSDLAAHYQNEDKILPITVKNYYLMSMCLLESKLWYNKRKDILVGVKK